MGDIGDYWREHKEYERKRELDFRNSPRGRAYVERERKKHQQFINQINNIVKQKSLIYKEFDEHHTRVKNPVTGKFCDFWSTGTMKTIEGKYQHFASNEEIINEIKKL